MKGKAMILATVLVALSVAQGEVVNDNRVPAAQMMIEMERMTNERFSGNAAAEAKRSVGVAIVQEVIRNLSPELKESAAGISGAVKASGVVFQSNSGEEGASKDSGEEGMSAMDAETMQRLGAQLRNMQQGLDNINLKKVPITAKAKLKAEIQKMKRELAVELEKMDAVTKESGYDLNLSTGTDGKSQSTK